MKTRNLLRIIAVMLLFAASCDEPETVVTNIVHRDGSVTRIVEMKNSSHNFSTSSLQVPVDSTWTIHDSVAVGEKGDTTWYRRAEKFFADAYALNLHYKNDSGYNRRLARSAGFDKRFMWFNTEFRFSERIGKTLSEGYPLEDFMNREQLDWYYSPGHLNEEKISGSDSLKYRALQDSVADREELWLMNSLASEFISEFGTLLGNSKADTSEVKKLKQNEQQLVKFLEEAEERNIDETHLADSILEEFIGPGAALRYSTEADSAIEIVVDKVLADFKEYTVRIVMPGRLVRSNGFIDSSGLVSWPVRSEFFLSEDYVMEAVSVMPNTWAWIVSGLFVVFVAAGMILRKIRRG